MRTNDKGFSLVELIVVIAIMAILVGVLAPAYLKYVEKSRKSSDIAAIDQVLNAAYAIATDEEYYVAIGTEFHLNAATGVVYFSIPVWTATANGIVRNDKDWERTENEWLEVSNKGDPYEMKSKDWSTMSGQIIGVVRSGGSLVWEVTDTDGVFSNMVEYSDDFASNFSVATTEEE